MSTFSLVLGWIFTVAGAGICSWLATRALRPVLLRYVVAHPNARSSHAAPTPQGGGIAVVVVALIAAGVALIWSSSFPPELRWHLIALAVGSAGLTVLGFADDMKSQPVVRRLIVQGAMVALVVLTLPPDLRIFPGHLPLWVERALILVGGLWFLNLYNFMDGIDLMSVTETASIAVGVLLLTVCGLAPSWLGWSAAALLGAILGFAPWNAPVARIFLGDAGSLAIGLMAGFLLLHVAFVDGVVVAIIIPLYYLLDATVTVGLRVSRGERFWEAHRSHFYQRAVKSGQSVPAVIRAVGALNAILLALALVAALLARSEVALAALAAAAVAALLVLRSFARAGR